jgi:hypothetical protein
MKGPIIMETGTHKRVELLFGNKDDGGGLMDI